MERMPTSANTQTFLEKSIEKYHTPEFEQKLDECEARWQAAEQARIKKEQEAAKLADIERLGGIRQYEDFRTDNYTNTPILRSMGNYPQENYYLWGAAGTGKTHAAVATIRKVKNAKLLRPAQISRIFRNDISAITEERYLREFATIPLLLDDLGTGKPTEFILGILFEIIDRRWSNKTGGLIVTANMNIPNLAKVIGDRTASRIAGLVGSKNVLELGGADRRLQEELF